jgi:hypothetical protein
MQSTLTQRVAREQTADRVRRADARRRVPQSSHPPSQVRWRPATVVARVAARS